MTRRRDPLLLIVAQFLTAFADNAVLFAALGMIAHTSAAAWYVPALQASFLVSYVVLAAWVGPFVDAHSKPRVLVGANLIKTAGAGLMLAGGEPLLAYAVVGVGAAIYSPAKYGILPEMVPAPRLMQLNAWVEGSTIVAILAGSLAGGFLVDRSVSSALAIIMGVYLASAATALFIRHMPVVNDSQTDLIRRFWISLKSLMVNHDARYALLGGSLFWSSAALLRLVIVAWAPAVLAISSMQGIAELTAWIALGIAVGSLLAPRLIPLNSLSRTRFPAYLMAVCILSLVWVESLWMARFVLIMIGLAGGLFVVPVNALLQDVGYRAGGSGAVVAVQRFVENLAMLIMTSLYGVAVANGLEPVASLWLLAALLMSGVVLLNRGGREDK